MEEKLLELVVGADAGTQRIIYAWLALEFVELVGCFAIILVAYSKLIKPLIAAIMSDLS